MSGMSGIVYNSTFNNDFSANKLRHTYVKGYVDISGGDLNLQNGAFTMYNGKTSGAYFSIQNDGKFWINSFGQFMSVSLENLKLLKDISIEGPSLGDLQIWTQGIRHDTTTSTEATDATEINRGGLTIKGTRFKSDTYAVFMSDVSINGILNANNDVSFNSRLFVGRDVSLGQKLFLKDDASFNSNLFVGNDVSLGKRLYLVGDASFNSNLFVGRDVSLGQKLFVKNFVSIGKSLPLMSLDISYADGIRLPTGTTNERPIKTGGGGGTGFTTQNGTDISVADKSMYVGTIRYNTTNSQFEGFGPGNSWGSLGGVINVAQNTKIVASSPNADSTNNELQFYTAPTNSTTNGDAKERMRILANGDVSINSNLFVGYDVSLGKRLYLVSDASFSSNLFVGRDVSLNSKLFVKNFVSIGKSLPLMSLDISYADGIRLPTGTTNERPIKIGGTTGFTTQNGTDINVADKSLYVGTIRYNTTNSQFEGFGPGNSWGSLGGVINVAQNTKILASSPAADSTNNELMFFTAPTNSTTTGAAVERMRILANGDVSMNNKLSVSGDVSFNSNLTVAGNVKIENTLTFKKQSFANGGSSGSPVSITSIYSLVEIGGTSSSTSYYSLSNGFFDGQTIKIVSINFDSSQYSLEVMGNIRLDSLNTLCSPVIFKTTCQSFDAVWINNAWIVTAYTGVNFTSSNIMFGTSGTGDIQLNAAGRLHVNSHSTIIGDVSLNSNLFVAANVGIGTTSSPSYKLDVNGTASATRFIGKSGGVASHIAWHNATGAFNESSSAFYGIGTITDHMTFSANQTMAVAATTPSMKLSASGNLTAYGFKSLGNNSTAASTQPDFNGDGTANHNLLLVSTKAISGGGTTPYSMALGVDFATGVGYINAAGNSTIQPVCLQTRGGNVGIGQTNPAFKLDVSGNSESLFRIQNNSGSWGQSKRASIDFNNASSAEMGRISSIDLTVGINGFWKTAMAFYVREHTGIILEGMRISSKNYQNVADCVSVKIYGDVEATSYVATTAIPANEESTKVATTAWVKSAISTATSGGSTFTGLTVNGDSRVTGKSYFGNNNPGGGGGDLAYIEYVQISGESTALRFFTANDADDNIVFMPGVDSNGVSNGKVGIKTNAPDTTLHVNGDVKASTYNAVSDYREKENVVPLDDSFNVDVLKPVTYNLKESGKQDVGFIAHEVQEFYPFLVSGEKDGKKTQSLNYNGLIGILTKEIKDLKKEMCIVRLKLEAESKTNAKLNSDVSVLHEANAKLNEDFTKLASEMSVLRDIVQELMPL
jgi:acetyltransferase-like isoleucine patch superfamily enzyme